MDNATIPTNWCPLPSMHLSLSPEGEILPCCKYSEFTNINQNTLIEVFDGKGLTRLREEFRQNKRPAGCSDCWRAEENKEFSFRQSMISRIGLIEIQKIWNSDPKIRYLELKLSNLCNLMCRMCSSKFSSRWQKWEEKVGTTGSASKSPYWSNEIASQISRIVNDPEFRIICFAGGEPLIDPKHYQILSMIQKKSSLHYVVNTNLTRIQYLGKCLVDWLKDFGSVGVIVSIDGDRDLQNYIRCGLNLHEFEKNVNDLVINSSLENWKLYSSSTISIYNIFAIPSLYEYTIKLDLIPLPPTILTSPQYLQLMGLSKRTRNKITFELMEWHQNFSLESFIEKNGLIRVKQDFQVASENLKIGVQTILSALNSDNPIDFCSEQLIKATLMLDRKFQKHIRDSAPQLYKEFFMDCENV